MHIKLCMTAGFGSLLVVPEYFMHHKVAYILFLTSVRFRAWMKNHRKNLVSSVQNQPRKRLRRRRNKHTSLLPAVRRWRRRACSPRTAALRFSPACCLPAPPGRWCRRRSNRCRPLPRPSSSSRCRSSSVPAAEGGTESRRAASPRGRRPSDHPGSTRSKKCLGGGLRVTAVLESGGRGWSGSGGRASGEGGCAAVRPREFEDRP